jgi:RNA polymerase sigma-70 factor (ECF subfamily)
MGGIGGVVALPVPGAWVRADGKLALEPNRDDEAALVRRVQAGDELAFREVVERYQNKVHSIIYGILRNRNDAEDIAQQVFTKVYFSIGSFDSRSSLLTWIYKIAVNECYDYLRKRRVRKLVYESDFSEEDAERLARSGAAVEASPSAEARLASHDYVVKLLARVSEEDRNLLMLKEVEGHSVEELAALTGMNQNTIKVKLFRARQKLLRAAKRLSGPPAAAGGLGGAEGAAKRA